MKKNLIKREEVIARMAKAYWQLLSILYPLILENKDIEIGLKEGMSKFLSWIPISLNGKKNTDFYSEKAYKQLQLGNKSNLIYEHIIPKEKYIQTPIIQSAKDGKLKSELEIKELLNKYWYIATITKDEDKILSQLGFNKKMPDDWDNQNIFARYDKANIKLYTLEECKNNFKNYLKNLLF